MVKCSCEKIDLVFAEIAKTAALYIPSNDKNNKAVFTKWQKGTKLCDSHNTQIGPKDLFFPQTEDLMAFKASNKKIEIIDTRKESEDFVIFGVRACDVKSLEILDRVFLSEPRDSYYAMRREHGIIISLACTRPSEACFCTTFGIAPSEPGADISVWKINNEFFWQANTKRGEELLLKIEHFTTPAEPSEVEGEKQRISVLMKRLPLANLSTNGFGKGKTNELFEREEWAKLSEACLGCGTCTFVCPTCQCYDIKDFNTGNGVIRYRCWDSCMYSDFTKMAHGNNRNTRKERFRQRFMHKLVYFPENNNGLFGCVGCGRCISKCPVSMNIVKVMKKLGGKV